MTNVEKPGSGGRHTLFLTRLVENHTPSGGYNQLAVAMPGQRFRRLALGPAGDRLAYKLWVTATSPERWPMEYDYRDFVNEMRAIVAVHTRRVDLVHALYGEFQIDILARHRNLLRRPLVATFHMPIPHDNSVFNALRDDISAALDAAVTVSRHMVPHYAEWFGAENVFYVPHGVHTDRFTPAECSPNASLTLVVVGNFMRDWDSIAAVVQHVHQACWPIEFHFFGNDDKAGRFLFPNCHFHAREAEEELVAWYRRADALFMPLEDATANNAILEALACGTPVMSTRCGGISDYVDETCGWLVAPGDTRQFCDLLGAVCADRSLAAAKRHGARQRALMFRWEDVAKQMTAVHAHATEHYAQRRR